MKRRIIPYCITFAIIFSMFTMTNVFAGQVTNSAYWNLQCTSDAGVHFISTKLYCNYCEVVEKGTNYVRFTDHTTYAYIYSWPGDALGFDITVYGGSKADYSNASGTYIKSANMAEDTRSYYNDTNVTEYDRTWGTDIATVNTIPAKATTVGSFYCPEALWGSGQVTCTLNES